MIDERFSEAAFSQLGLDTDASRRLADLLRDEIQRELHTAIDARLRELVDRINSMGHRLKLEYAPIPGEISYRHDWKDETGYQCRLRVAVDTVVSTGYAHLIDPVETNDQIPS
ncbi:MAG: hypothetical protein AB1898_32645 [Acidobacteriota bacterium]